MTTQGGSICEHLTQVTRQFLPEVTLVSLSHISDTDRRFVAFKPGSPMSLYTRVFRQLAFMLYDSILFESIPGEMPNSMSKEHYVSSR